MQLRRNLSIPREAAVNAFDVADMIGADVRFLDAPSLEGMLVRDPGLRVLLPSTKHRPFGRILFSCAHEVAHHYLGHGTTVDSYLQNADSSADHSDDEFLADSFAGHLLMPRPAVISAFSRRSWDPTDFTPKQAFIVAGELGVGYTTLLRHLNQVMHLLPSDRRQSLSKVRPKEIKAGLFGEDCSQRVVYVDNAWAHVPIDAEVGDVIIMPDGTGDDCPLLIGHRQRDDQTIYVASNIGESHVGMSHWIRIRVARHHYVGPFYNRYLDDPDEY